MQQKSFFSRAINWLLITLTLFSLVAAAFPAGVAFAADDDDDDRCSDTHKVKPGETLRRIAKDYEVKLARLAKTNDIKPPYNVAVGDEICIPNDASLPSKSSWTPVYRNGKINIEGAGFKKTHPFFVRVRETDTSPWYKLGKLASDKDGEFDKSFTVPKALSKAFYLNVCLKDGVTDLLVCKRVARQ